MKTIALNWLKWSSSNRRLLYEMKFRFACKICMFFFLNHIFSLCVLLTVGVPVERRCSTWQKFLLIKKLREYLRFLGSGRGALSKCFHLDIFLRGQTDIYAYRTQGELHILFEWTLPQSVYQVVSGLQKHLPGRSYRPLSTGEIGFLISETTKSNSRKYQFFTMDNKVSFE